MASDAGNLLVPHTLFLPDKLRPGETVTVRGTVNILAERIEINFMSAQKNSFASRDGPFHIFVRFDQKKLIFNSSEGGAFGKEEKVANPYLKGEDFDLRIRAHNDKFEIFANQKVIYNFKHRQELYSIECIEVRGDLTLKTLKCAGKYYEIPFEETFGCGFLKNGERICIHGTPTGKRFEVNLLGSNGDILFHYNPRFKEKQVVRNSCTNGVWAKEEREGPFPFKKDIGFDLIIANEPYSIQIFHNDQRIGTFAHRTSDPSQNYFGIRIDGDVEIRGIEYYYP